MKAVNRDFTFISQWHITHVQWTEPWTEQCDGINGQLQRVLGPAFAYKLAIQLEQHNLHISTAQYPYTSKINANQPLVRSPVCDLLEGGTPRQAREECADGDNEDVFFRLHHGSTH
jgi:hypothetical protein